MVLFDIQAWLFTGWEAGEGSCQTETTCFNWLEVFTWCSTGQRLSLCPVFCHFLSANCVSSVAALWNEAVKQCHWVAAVEWRSSQQALSPGTEPAYVDENTHIEMQSCTRTHLATDKYSCTHTHTFSSAINCKTMTPILSVCVCLHDECVRL